MFDLIEFIFPIFFLAVFGFILFNLFRGAAQWNKNNRSPRLTVEARIVSKRTNVSHHHHGGEMHRSSTSTSYFVTFQVKSGDRMELRVAGHEYGMLVEGDFGDLTFQGTRYLSFERKAGGFGTV